MKFVRPTDKASIERLVDNLRATEPNYAQIGATLTGARPTGFRHDNRKVVVGQGMETFERAVQALKGWQSHSLFGVKVHPEGTEIRTGATVIVTLGHFVALTAPCRIVNVIDEPQRWGFAYGTLPGHPEQGEEAFVVSISDAGTVSFEITAFSRPANVLVRVSRPLGREIQKGYLRALRQSTFHAG